VLEDEIGVSTTEGFVSFLEADDMSVSEFEAKNVPPYAKEVSYYTSWEDWEVGNISYLSNLRRRLQSSLSTSDDKASDCHDRFCEEEFFQEHMDVYLFFFSSACMVWCGWRCIVVSTYRCLKACCCKSEDLSIAQSKFAEHDFYRCIDFRTLRNEYLSALGNLSLFKQM
jgi:hypothetical protein